VSGATQRVVDPAADGPRQRPLRQAVVEARDHLLGLQKPDGHWCAELQGDTILESEYVLLLASLGEEASEVARKAAAYILEQQRDDGTWSNYPDGPVEVSVSVKAYFALNGSGPSAHPRSRRGREV
jgi:squalene-hopene/tetraprenyl-beta-curcumene cyclase